jgi:chromosome segregation ATPase
MHLKELAVQDATIRELKNTHLAQINIQDRKIHDLNIQLDTQKDTFLDKISSHKAENSQLLRTIDASNKDIRILQSTLQKTEQSLKFH